MSVALKNSHSETKKKSNWLPKLLVGFIASLFLALFYFNTTLVQGVEFNPVSWQIRTFTFRADPLTRFQWTGIEHDSTRWTIDPSIMGLLNAKARTEPGRWDLAEIRQFRQLQSGPSMMIVQLLSGYRFSSSSRAVQHWVEWTKAHPNKAKEFWPAVQDLALVDAYSEMPELLELVLVEKDDQQFSEALHRQMLAALRNCARQQLLEKNLPAAARSAQAGLSYAAGDPELTEILTKSGGIPGEK